MNKALFLPLVSILLMGRAPSAAAASAAWTELGTHPAAAEQPTEWARAIRFLQPWNGKLYMGYGDIDQNIGPIELYSYSPATRTFAKEWTLQTEIINNFCPIGDRLFVPANRPFRTNDPAYAVCDADGQWSNGSVHLDIASDMATLTGEDLWLVGARDKRGVALRSLDGGVTWKEMLRCPHTGGKSCHFDFSGVLNTKLYMECSIRKTSMVFDEEHWREGPYISRFAKRIQPFNEQILGLVKGIFAVFDGEHPSSFLGIDDSRISDFLVSKGTVMILVPDQGLILKSQDIVAWEPVTIPPPHAICMAILDGKLYVGTKDSKLYVYNGQLPAEFR